MATNFFFNNFQNSQEQLLIEDLIIESIKIFGNDVIYIPRTTGQIDEILNEDVAREYKHAMPVEMYIKNVEGFAGEGDFLSKFNIQIRDQITFCLARRTFADEIGFPLTQYNDTNRDRPLEGDLIYFPLNKKVFEVKFVEHEAIFYQLGSLQMFELRCELYEYSNEYFNTGVADVDRLMSKYSITSEIGAVLTESGLIITTEEGFSMTQESFDMEHQDPIADNSEFQTESDLILDFTERDPFSEGTY